MPGRFLRAFSILVLATMSVYGCPKSEKQSASSPREVDYVQAVKMLSSQNPPVVIDVRTPEEFNGELGHIPDARLIPMETTSDSMKVYEQFKDRDILLVCRSGRRSKIVGDELIKAGFKKVYNLTGGMKGWIEKGGATEISAE